MSSRDPCHVPSRLTPQRQHAHVTPGRRNVALERDDNYTSIDPKQLQTVQGRGQWVWPALLFLR